MKHLKKATATGPYRAYHLKRGAGGTGYYPIADFRTVESAVRYIRSENEEGEFLICSPEGNEVYMHLTHNIFAEGFIEETA